MSLAAQIEKLLKDNESESAVLRAALAVVRRKEDARAVINGPKALAAAIRLRNGHKPDTGEAASVSGDGSGGGDGMYKVVRALFAAHKKPMSLPEIWSKVDGRFVSASKNPRNMLGVTVRTLHKRGFVKKAAGKRWVSTEK